MKAKLIASVIKTLHPQDKPYDVWDMTLPNFVLRVRPTGAMAYFFVYRTAGGNKTRYRIGDVRSLSPAQARDVAEQLSARTIQGENIQATKQRQRQEGQNAKLHTLQGFLEHSYGPWLLAERPEKRRSVEVLQRLRTNFADWLERPLIDINSWVIDKWRSEQVKRGKSKATINRDLTVLRGVLSKAVLWKVIVQHPLEPIKPLKVDTNGVIRYLSDDEEQSLRAALIVRDANIKAARDRGNAWRKERNYTELATMTHHAYADHVTPMVLLSLNTGVRRGELFALCWDDVNVKTKTLTIRGTTAKSRQTRHIPLNREALDVLQAWRQQSPDASLVFPGKTGRAFDNTRKSWAGVLKTASICNFRWHDLRHTFGSKLVMAGVPLNTVRELLGHTTLAMTLRYAHLAPDHKSAAVERLCAPDVTPARSIVHG